jgi:hypothetical protein
VTSRTVSARKAAESPFFAPGRGRGGGELGVRPGFAGGPVRLDLGAELLTGCDLLAGHLALLGRQPARLGLAPDPPRETEIGPVPRGRVRGATAPGLVALDVPFRESAAPHGRRHRQLRREFAHTLGNVQGFGHVSSLRITYP